MGEYQSDQYYDFPKENESYVHRTLVQGRAENRGHNLFRLADRGQVDVVMGKKPFRSSKASLLVLYIMKQCFNKGAVVSNE